ncbi:MAG: hypothetical protein JWP52_4636 [Rhizobacter sp.]|nr:hypothetical protein [Rhizobacter sp.]
MQPRSTDGPATGGRHRVVPLAPTDTTARPERRARRRAAAARFLHQPPAAFRGALVALAVGLMVAVPLMNLPGGGPDRPDASAGDGDPTAVASGGRRLTADITATGQAEQPAATTGTPVATGTPTTAPTPAVAPAVDPAAPAVVVPEVNASRASAGTGGPVRGSSGSTVPAAAATAGSAAVTTRPPAASSVRPAATSRPPAGTTTQAPPPRTATPAPTTHPPTTTAPAPTTQPCLLTPVLPPLVCLP